MNKCITCKHWKQWNDTPNYGACFLLVMLQDTEASIFPANKALRDIKVSDKTFNTGKNFGCIHHNTSTVIKSLSEIRKQYGGS